MRRRRTERERSIIFRFAGMDLVRNPAILDDFDRASRSRRPIATMQGVELI